MLSQKKWKVSALFRLFLGLFASLLLGISIINLLDHGKSDAQAKFVAFIVGTASFHGMGLVLISLFLCEHGLGWHEAFGFSRPRLGRAVLLGLMAGILVLPIAWSLSQVSAKILTWFEFEPVMQQSVETLLTAKSWNERLYFGLMALVIAPVVEEMIFRGILYPALKEARFPEYAWWFRYRLYPNFRHRGWHRPAIWLRYRLCPQLLYGGQQRLALWISSLLFAATHGNLMTFVPLAFLAVVLAVLYETTDNLLSPILTHSFFNGANYFWVLVRPS